MNLGEPVDGVCIQQRQQQSSLSSQKLRLPLICLMMFFLHHQHTICAFYCTNRMDAVDSRVECASQFAQIILYLISSLRNEHVKNECMYIRKKNNNFHCAQRQYAAATFISRARNILIFENIVHGYGIRTNCGCMAAKQHTSINSKFMGLSFRLSALRIHLLNRFGHLKRGTKRTCRRKKHRLCYQPSENT